jgi:hypothetical protein
VRPLLAVAFLIFVSVQASAQRDINWDTVQIKTQKLDDNVYVLQFMGPDGPAGNVGGNVGAFIGADGIAIVDSGYAPAAPKLEAALKAVSEKPRRCREPGRRGEDARSAAGYPGGGACRHYPRQEPRADEARKGVRQVGLPERVAPHSK